MLIHRLLLIRLVSFPKWQLIVEFCVCIVQFTVQRLYPSKEELRCPLSLVCDGQGWPSHHLPSLCCLSSHQLWSLLLMNLSLKLAATRTPTPLAITKRKLSLTPLPLATPSFRPSRLAVSSMVEGPTSV